MTDIDLPHLQRQLDDLPLEHDRVLDDERRIKTLATALHVQPALLRAELRNHGLPPTAANAVAVMTPWLRTDFSDAHDGLGTVHEIGSRDERQRRHH